MSAPATLKDIARHAGVSPTAVSLALRDSPRVSVGARARIRQLAHTLGYQQNPFAASLVSLRTAKNPKYRSTLALLNCYATCDGWRQYSCFERFHHGVVSRARELGYLIEEFWFGDPALPPARLRRVLLARGIPGLILAFLDEGHRAVADLRRFDFAGFGSAALGWRVEDLGIHAASNDQFHSVGLATRQLHARGYRRVGLVLNEGIDTGLEHRYRAGFLLYQAGLPATGRVPIFDDADLRRSRFFDWIDSNRVDAVLALPAGLHRWLLERGTRIPDEIGFACLDRATGGEDLAGIDQKSERVGAASVDMVVGQLHRHEHGLSALQETLFIRGEWVDGWSVRPPGEGQPLLAPAVRPRTNSRIEHRKRKMTGRLASA